MSHANHGMPTELNHNGHEHTHHHDHAATTLLQATSPIPTTTNPNGMVDALIGQIDSSQQHHHHHPESHHSMKMFFHGGCQEVILFDFWRSETFSGLFLSLILVFLMGVLYEGVKWFRVYFQLWTTANLKSSDCTVSMSVTKRSNGGTNQQGLEEVLIEKVATLSPNSTACCDGNSASVGNTLISQEVYAPTVLRTPQTAGSSMPINRWIWLMMYINREFSPSTCKFIETAIYILQLVLAYWLMLIAMTFNTYLTVAVVLGAGFGHWIFANIKCAPPRRCFCPACCNGAGGPEHIENFLEDACH